METQPFSIQFEVYEYQDVWDTLNDGVAYYEDGYVEPQPLSPEEFRNEVLGFASTEIFQEKIEETVEKLGYKLSETEEKISSEVVRKVHYIQSVVGDDEHTTSDSWFLGILLIAVGQVLSSIRISWKDCGISHWVGNYAEGYIITPPTAEASFEAVNRRNAGSGIPFVLDPVKLKYLSPVRKQSEMELDLESKLTHLADIAGWTHPSWFTYDYHQMSLLLALVSFDFVGCRSFPFLHKTEGGCGGSPPYNNIDTAISAIHKYTRGKSTRAILGVMKETVNIHLGETKPKDSFFLKSSHLAQMGDQAWSMFTTAYQSLLKGRGISRTEALDLLHQEGGSTLPANLLECATDIAPDDVVVGTAISHLRNDGFLMTELDVKMLLNKREKERAVFGREPMRQVIRRLDEDSAKFKANHWKILSEISAKSPSIRDSVQTRLGPEVDYSSAEVRNILSSYYALRSESHNLFTSFAYADVLRIFRTADVQRYLQKDYQLLRHDFLDTAGVDVVRHKFPNETISEALRKEKIVDWLDSDDLLGLLSKPLPAGIGPDDGRIFNSIRDQIENSQGKNFLVILFSSDRKLARYTQAYAQKYAKGKDLNITFVLIDRNAYINLCLLGVKELRELNEHGLPTAQAITRLGPMARVLHRRVPYFNYLLKEHWYLPSNVLTRIDDIVMGRGLPARKQFQVVMEYDIPNLERGLDLASYSRLTNTVSLHGGGFLRRDTVENLPVTTSWAATPMPDLQSWPDFTFQRDRKIFRAADISHRLEVRVFQPSSRELYVQSWRSNIRRASPVSSR